MRLSIIICTYNRAHSLAKVLASFDKLQSPTNTEVELVVVDNNSSDNTKQIVEEFIRLTLVQTKYIFEKKQGKSYALNTGVNATTGDIIAFTDDDVTIDSRWLWNIKNTFDQFDCIGFAGKVVPVWTHEKPSWLALEGPYKPLNVLVSYDLGPEYCVIKEKTTMPVGANYAFRQAAFKKYGLFRTDLDRVGTSLISGGDTEFIRRLLSHGETIMYDPNAIIYHPVEEQRLRKGYFRSWYFGHGRTMVRVSGFSNHLICYFGVPRYLLRLFCSQLLKWLFAFGEKKRFYQKLQLFQVSGQIAEAYNRSKKEMEHTSPASLV